MPLAEHLVEWHREQMALLAQLAPEDAGFVELWLSQPYGLMSVARERPSRLQAIVGPRSITLPGPPGSPTVSFYRDGQRYYLCSASGCVGVVVSWYGPFVMEAGRWFLEPPPPAPAKRYDPPPEWFESRVVQVGQEASWHGGSIRFRLDHFSPGKLGAVGRLLAREPPLASVGVHLTVASLGTFDRALEGRPGRMFPCKLGPFSAPGLLGTTERGVVFEILSMTGQSGAFVRAGTEAVSTVVRKDGES